MKSQRSIEFAWLTLAAIPGDIWCALHHICVDGHLYHKEMPAWWLLADFVWVAAFVLAGILVWRSDVSRPYILSGIILFLVVSRMLWASGRGTLYFIEVPALIYLGILAMWTIHRVLWQRKQRTNEVTETRV